MLETYSERARAAGQCPRGTRRLRVWVYEVRAERVVV